MSGALKVIVLRYLSCAVHFRSERARTSAGELQRLLQEVNIYRASDILTTYEINSQGINQRVPKQGLIRLAEEDGQLNIFIPRQDTDLKEIWSTYLPKEMTVFLEINGARAVEAVTGILNAATDRLGIALDRRGILHPETNRSLDLSAVDDEPVTIYERNSQADTVLGMTGPTGNWIDQGIYGSSELPQGASNGLVSQNLHISSVFSQNNGTVLTTLAPRQYGRRTGSMLEENEIEPSGISLEGAAGYHGGRPALNEINSVIGNFEAQRQAVIEHARSSNTATFNLVASSNIITSWAPMPSGTAIVTVPQLGSSFDMSSIASALPTTAATGTNENTASQGQMGGGGFYLQGGAITSSSRPAARNRQQRVSDFAIGFLGEQYIVTILKDKLRSFREDLHWTSTLREYAGLPLYPYREVTDITFPDNDGHLSQLLLSWSHGATIPDWLLLAAVPVPMVRPTFWLEVKTTPGMCETPFYVSNAQYKHVSYPGFFEVSI
jgi:hypothetical protein